MPTDTAKPDRDERGLFKPGHGVKSPGNPIAQKIHRLREQIIAQLDDGSDLPAIARIVASLIDDATSRTNSPNERTTAAGLLLKYAVPDKSLAAQISDGQGRTIQIVLGAPDQIGDVDD